MADRWIKRTTGAGLQQVTHLLNVSAVQRLWVGVAGQQIVLRAYIEDQEGKEHQDLASVATAQAALATAVRDDLIFWLASPNAAFNDPNTQPSLVYDINARVAALSP